MKQQLPYVKVIRTARLKCGMQHKPFETEFTSSYLVFHVLITGGAESDIMRIIWLTGTERALRCFVKVLLHGGNIVVEFTSL